ncbi:MAG: UDP-N-acetylglucosamine 2-epimerase, partial [Prevotella sp.]|nr:UDP-N-acetylglucosamine 2-epimerase [Prevotella sp.]
MSNNSIANREGAEQSKVYMVGNLLIDNLRYNRTRLRKPQLFDDLKLSSGQYIVFTLNRKKLIGDTENLGPMLSAMLRAAGDMPVVAPLRGNAAKVVKSLADSGKLDRYDNLHIVDPLNFLEFSYLMANARGVVTDSGNVAEEATFNSVPCITLNSYTEHIETVKVGTNVLVGEDAERLCEAVGDMVCGNWKPSAIPDRWDGRTAERIVQTICNVLSQSHK